MYNAIMQEAFTETLLLSGSYITYLRAEVGLGE